jgi:LPXTG-site transpeptidase (sortase) family protein
VILHAYGQQYVYAVRTVREVYPDSLSILNSPKGTWLTLLTCKEYNEATGQYRRRIAVQAVLVNIK